MQEGTDRADAPLRLLEPGEQFGDYVVERLLGKGGMGAVYLVRAPGGQQYAIKIMYPWILEKNRGYRKRFAREAEFAMKIRHKNLISVYDVGEDPETGLDYIIMDYVPGGTVADRLEQDGPIPTVEAVSIACQVALALEVAHRNGVIHRDIKPDNIMFDADGTPRLTDLGVAKFMGREQQTTVTTTGMVIGTPAYMAPEQMIDSHQIDARADIYALGVVLYEMLSGKRPREGSTAVELLAKAIKGEPIPDVRTDCPEVPEAVAYVISLMCAPRPEGRPATALATAKLLRDAAAGRISALKKKSRAARARVRRRRVAISVGAVSSALFCAGLAFMFRGPAPEGALQPPSPPAVTNVVTNVVVQTRVETNFVDRVVVKVVTNTVEVVRDGPVKLPEGPGKHPPVHVRRGMAANEKILKWIDRKKPESAISVCFDLSHGDFPGVNVFSDNSFWGRSGFKFKACWRDIASEDLDAVNVLVLTPSPALLYNDNEREAIRKFLSGGGTVVAFVTSDENSVRSMNEFFAPYKLEVFAEREDRRGREKQAVPTCSALFGMSLKLALSSFAAPLDDVGAAEWSSVLRDYDGNIVFASRRVGRGNLVFAAAGLMWWRSDGNGNPVTITADGNKMFWLSIFGSAARNRPISAVDVQQDTSGPQPPTAMVNPTVRHVIFPHADLNDAKWKNRAHWRYTVKYPSVVGASSRHWTDPMFHDSWWSRTNKPLGLGKSQELMRIAEKWKSPRLYMRRHFNWNGETVKNVELTLCQDCRATVYLNGTSILDRYASDGSWQKADVSVDTFAGALRKGDNVLAVEAYAYSGVRYFDCGLTVECEE